MKARKCPRRHQQQAKLYGRSRRSEHEATQSTKSEMQSDSNTEQQHEKEAENLESARDSAAAHRTVTEHFSSG